MLYGMRGASASYRAAPLFMLVKAGKGNNFKVVITGEGADSFLPVIIFSRKTY
jgi:asparagine synthetase B (glutamine-hydrolysing)